MNGFGKATASQIAEKAWFWVAQRFSAAIRPLFPSAALAAEVTDSISSEASPSANPTFETRSTRSSPNPPDHITQRQFQPAELGMVVHAQRVSDVEPISCQQL